MIGQFHREQRFDGVCRRLLAINLTKLVKPPVMMRDQLPCAPRAVEKMPVMATDDQPFRCQLLKISKILIIGGQHVAVRFAEADRDVR